MPATIRIESFGETKVKVTPVTFLGQELFPVYVNAAKRAGATYDPGIRTQVAAPRVVPHLVEAFRAEGFEVELTPDLRAILQALAATAREEQRAASARLDRIDARMAEKGRALFPFQRVGIEWLAPRKGAILADEMGLGKTIQAIGGMPETATRIVAIVPAGVKGSWENEIGIWRDDLQVSVLQGRNSFRWPRGPEELRDEVRAQFGNCCECPNPLDPKSGENGPQEGQDVLPTVQGPAELQQGSTDLLGLHRGSKVRATRADLPERFLDPDRVKRCPRCSHVVPPSGEVILLNYDILPANAAQAGVECPEGVVLIADEAHAIKGAKTARTKKFRDLANAVRSHGGRVWLLTGTPLLNRKNELWALLVAGGLVEETFGNYRTFDSYFFWDFVEDCYKARPEIGPILSKVMLRRVTEEVLPDLPKLRRTRIGVPIEELDPEAVRLADEALAAIAARGMTLDDAIKQALSRGLPGFEEIARARAALATAKIPILLEQVEEYEEEGVPVVVFSDHRAPVDILASRPGWATITGSTDAAKRTQIVERFQAGELKGVGITVKAGGVGITLTRAWNAISVDRPWTPALQEQAEKRINRIGQTKPCLVKWLAADHPLEERIDEILLQKMELIDQTIESAARHQREEGIVHEADRLSEVVEASREGLPTEEPPVPEARRFDARFPSRCSKCSGKVHPGDPIWYHQGQVWHYICPEVPNMPALVVPRVRVEAAGRTIEFTTYVTPQGVFRGPKDAREVWAIRGLLEVSEPRPGRPIPHVGAVEVAARIRAGQGLSEPQWEEVLALVRRAGWPGEPSAEPLPFPVSQDDYDPGIAEDDVPF